MTAHFIARVVQSLYDKIDIDAMLKEFDGIEKYQHERVSDEWTNRQITNKAYIRWVMACGTLEAFCRKNIGKFKETELVYRWAKQQCDQQNILLNRQRLFGSLQK